MKASCDRPTHRKNATGDKEQNGQQQEHHGILPLVFWPNARSKTIYKCPLHEGVTMSKNTNLHFFAMRTSCQVSRR